MNLYKLTKNSMLCLGLLSIVNYAPVASADSSIKLGYCSGSSGQGDWIVSGQQTPSRACQLLRDKFNSWRQNIRRIEFGYYNANEKNNVKVYCFNGFTFSTTGLGNEAFNQAIGLVRQNNVEGTCVYKIY